MRSWEYNSQEYERSWEDNSQASSGPVPSAIDVWKPRDTLSEKIFITHHCPVNRSSWVEGGDEDSEQSWMRSHPIRLPSTQRRPDGHGTALMLMNLIISRCGGTRFLKRLHYFWGSSHSRRITISKSAHATRCKFSQRYIWQLWGDFKANRT